MAVQSIEDFVQLSEGEIAHQSDGLKVTLSKLALEVNAAFQTASPSGVEFIRSSVCAVSALKGTAHADLRINCLLDAANF